MLRPLAGEMEKIPETHGNLENEQIGKTARELLSTVRFHRACSLNSILDSLYSVLILQ